MSEYTTLAVLAAFVLAYASISARLAKTVVSSAMLFTGFGLLCGPLGLNMLRLDVKAELLRFLAEITLALVLFTDAAMADLRVLRLSIGVSARLLLIGLPLTIAMGIGAGALLFEDLSLVELCLLATMLAPTDAALGKPVVTNPDVPASIRESLNVESGLNDGICVPLLFIFLALAHAEQGEWHASGLALRLILEEIGLGAIIGAATTLLAAAMLRFSARRGWINVSWLPTPIMALAITCFAAAQAFGGSGFIAAFVGGLTFGRLVKRDKEKLLHAAEGTGAVFCLLTWVVFGVGVVGRSIELYTWRIVLYAVLSLTVVRMVPVLLALMGTSLKLNSRLFIGWFGPRGLASVVFIILVLGEDLPGQDTLALTVVGTVVLSILAHGLTALPLAAAYGAGTSRNGV